MGPHPRFLVCLSAYPLRGFSDCAIAPGAARRSRSAVRNFSTFSDEQIWDELCIPKQCCSFYRTRVKTARQSTFPKFRNNCRNFFEFFQRPGQTPSQIFFPCCPGFRTTYANNKVRLWFISGMSLVHMEQSGFELRIEFLFKWTETSVTSRWGRVFLHWWCWAHPPVLTWRSLEWSRDSSQQERPLRGRGIQHPSIAPWLPQFVFRLGAQWRFLIWSLIFDWTLTSVNRRKIGIARNPFPAIKPTNL